MELQKKERYGCLIAIVASFVAVLAVAVLRIGTEALPAGARPEVIEERFHAQIEFLRHMASTYPARECEPEPPGGRGYQETLDFIQQLGERKEWKDYTEESADLFSDPVILGASILCFRSDATITLDLKDFEEPPQALSRAMILPRNRHPKVSLWYAGDKRFIKYEEKVGESSGIEKGFELFLDAERLKDE